MKNLKTLLFVLLVLLNSSESLSQISIGWVARYNNQNFGYDVGLALTVDNNGNVYVTGNSYGNQTRRDLVVIKYSPVGTNLWTKRIADTVTNGTMSGSDIVLDIYHNVIVGGDGIYKYDPNGNLLWSNASIGSRRMSLDSAGNTFNMTGQTFYLTKKANSGGALVWERIYPFYQFTYNHVPTDICVDKEQNVLVTGRSRETAVVLYDYATVKYSNAGDLIWERRYNGGNEDQAYAIVCDDSNNVYVTGWNKNSSTDIRTIKYSPDGDTVWQAVYDGGGFDVGYDIEVDSLGCVYVGGVTNSSSYVTLKYDVSGNLMWSRVQASQQIPYSPVLKLDRNRNVYMSFVSFRPGPFSNYAVVKYDNEGNQKWIAEYFSEGFNYIRDLTLDKNMNVYVTGQSGSSIGTVKFVQTPTQTNETTSSGIPESYFLEQNYPNPFNPSTIINYELRIRNFVMLKVYDIAGREVASLVNEIMPAGKHAVEFNAADLPSGVYFYSLNVDGKQMGVKRMALVK